VHRTATVAVAIGTQNAPHSGQRDVGRGLLVATQAIEPRDEGLSRHPIVSGPGFVLGVS
jgi:hypothetical protein